MKTHGHTNAQTKLHAAELSVHGAFAGKHVLVTGVTGFLGKVFHLWNLRYLTPASEEEMVFLFTEGFTNYFSVAALTQAGLMTEVAFAEFLSNYRHYLEDNPRYADADLEAIQRGFAENDAALRDLAYTKGLFVALLLDLPLRDETEGRASLASWFRVLVRRFGGVGGYRVADLRSSLVEVAGLAGGEVARRFDEAFVGPGPLDLDALFVRLGIRCRARRECELEELSEREREIRTRAFSAR